MLNIHHFHTYSQTFWVMYSKITELFQAWIIYRVLQLISGIYIYIYIYQNQEIMLFFCFSRKTSLKIQIEAFFVFSKYKVEEIFFFCVAMLFFGTFLAQFRFDSQFKIREQFKKYFFLCKFGINHLSKKVYKVKTSRK